MSTATPPDPQKDFRMKAVDSSLEWSKQIITLAAGTLVLSGTFIKDLFSDKASYHALIICCWICLLLSALLGIIFLGALCSLLTGANTSADLDLYNHPARWIGIVHACAFLLGLFLFILYISLNLSSVGTVPGPSGTGPGPNPSVVSTTTVTSTTTSTSTSGATPPPAAGPQAAPATNAVNPLTQNPPPPTTTNTPHVKSAVNQAGSPPAVKP